MSNKLPSRGMITGASVGANKGDLFNTLLLLTAAVAAGSTGTATPSGISGNFVDGIEVTAAGSKITLPSVPNPTASLILVQRLKNMSGTVLIQGIDYSLSKADVTLNYPPNDGDRFFVWYRTA